MSFQRSSQFSDVLNRFGFSADSVSVTCLGSGNINDTYLVFDGRKKVVLQKLSPTVFPDPEIVATNFYVVSLHLMDAAKRKGIRYTCSKPILTDDGNVVFVDEYGNCWRGQSYLEHKPVSDMGFNLGLATQLGRVLAQFHLLTTDLDGGLLGNPLPGFHITPVYLTNYRDAFQQWRGSSSPELTMCFRFADMYEGFTHTLEDAKQKGRLQNCIIHGDPKIDNIIFTPDGKASGFFDLDTTGSGLIHYDLGDCLRSCCNRTGESGANWEQVSFDLKIYEALLRGYLQTAGDMLSEWDKEYIYASVCTITYELAVRFLTDYLCGNHYFKVSGPRENLWRSLRQFHLLDSIVTNETAMKKVITRVTGGH